MFSMSQSKLRGIRRIAPNSEAQDTETRACTFPCLKILFIIIMAMIMMMKAEHYNDNDDEHVDGFQHLYLVKKVAGAWPGLM